MRVVTLPVGPLQANCYVITDPVTNCAAVVDPGGDAEVIVREIAYQRATPVAILCTHAHPDHIAALLPVAEQFAEADVFMHPADVNMLADYAVAELGDIRLPELQPYDEGVEVRAGELTIRVLHTPGHSPGSVCLALDDEKALLTGDLIFAGGIGRADLPGGSYPALLASLRRLISEFPADTILYPGHGPQSTLDIELATNPWLMELV